MSRSQGEKQNGAVQPACIKKVIRPYREEIHIRLKPEEPVVRYLKIQPFYRESRSQLLHKPRPKIVPEIRLCGNWLEEAGFYPCNYASVTVMNGLIIVRQSEEQPPE